MDFLTQACNDEGYANAEINPKVNTRENEQLVDVDFQINKGELVYINHINISGNTYYPGQGYPASTGRCRR